VRIEEIRTDLAARMRARRGEIEQIVLTRAHSVAELPPDSDYAGGLREAVAAAIDFGLLALERSEDRAPPIPTALLAQARLAARSGVKLDTVLRRYLAGYNLLVDVLIDEAAADRSLQGSSLQRLLRSEAALFDRLITAVSEEYARENEGRFRSAQHRQSERVRMLLAGELFDAPDLRYELGGHHIGVCAVGGEAPEAIRGAAADLDRRLLLVPLEDGTTWAWLGSRHRRGGAEMEALERQDWPSGTQLAFGEPAEALAGWRLTHRQAKAALRIAMRSRQNLVRYRDAALLAAILSDDLLPSSLQMLYLQPLERERDGGVALRETLRAYLVAGQNLSSAAAALGISRHTVKSRLQVAEARFGQSLEQCAAEVDAALKLHHLNEEDVPAVVGPDA
jgi:PucR-like helix-turn-helix protein/diguanylate cyclase with GGDEF domain